MVLNETERRRSRKRAGQRNGYWTKIYGEKTEDNVMLRVERYLLNAMPLCGAVTKLTGSRLGAAGPPRPGRLSRAPLRTPPPSGRRGASRHAERGWDGLPPPPPSPPPPPPPPLSIASRKRAAPPPSATSPVIHFAEGCFLLSVSLSRPLAPALTPEPTSRRRRFSSFQKNLARPSGLLSGSPPTPESR